MDVTHQTDQPDVEHDDDRVGRHWRRLLAACHYLNSIYADPLATGRDIDRASELVADEAVLLRLAKQARGHGGGLNKPSDCPRRAFHRKHRHHDWETETLVT